MKISTLLSVSALLAMFSVVACSSSTVPAGGEDQEQESEQNAADDEDDGKKETTKSSSSSSGGTTTGTTQTQGDDDGEACMSCLAQDPKTKAAFDCMEEKKCAEGDDACAIGCFDSAGCKDDDENASCWKQQETCASKCEPPPPTEEELAECTSCLSSKKNAQVDAIESCFTSAGEDDAKIDACYDMLESKCDQTCEAAYKACSSKCGG